MKCMTNDILPLLGALSTGITSICSVKKRMATFPVLYVTVIGTNHDTPYSCDPEIKPIFLSQRLANKPVNYDTLVSTLRVIRGCLERLCYPRAH